MPFSRGVRGNQLEHHLRPPRRTALSQLHVNVAEALLQRNARRSAVVERRLQRRRQRMRRDTLSWKNSGTSASPASRLGSEKYLTFTRPESRARNAVSGASR